MATVMIDAGHGGFDNGASYEGRKEKNDTLNLALAVGNLLENEGIDVLYTRTTDEYQSPREKANIANQSDAAYFISIHRNASTEPNTYSGVQTLVYENSGIPALFAQNINEELEKVGFVNLGTEERKNLAVLRGTNMPAALVEVGFIDTDRDNQLFDLKFPEMAQGIANGILETIQGAGVEAEELPQYTIAIGAFSHHDNAVTLARNLQNDSISCYIEPVNNHYQVVHGRFHDIEEAKIKQKEIYALGYEACIISR